MVVAVLLPSWLGSRWISTTSCEVDSVVPTEPQRNGGTGRFSTWLKATQLKAFTACAIDPPFLFSLLWSLKTVCPRWHVYSFPRAAVTKYHQQGALHRSLFSHSSRAQESRTKGPVGLVPSEGTKGESILGLCPSFWGCLQSLTFLGP